MTILRVIVSPVDETSARYIISIVNDTNDTFLDCVLDYNDLLHPGYFGLDSTHMPNNFWVQAPLHFASLAPGARIAFEEEGGGLPKALDLGGSRAKLSVSRIKMGKLQPEAREVLWIDGLMDWMQRVSPPGRAAPTWQKKGKRPKPG